MDLDTASCHKNPSDAVPSALPNDAHHNAVEAGMSSDIASVLVENRVFPPREEFVQRARLNPDRLSA
ncbi:MAG: hypothetical protein ACREE7_16575, partial [Dongiaceae bacterium]